MTDSKILTYKIARLVLDGDIHIEGSKDWWDYVHAIVELDSRVGKLKAQQAVGLAIADLRAQENANDQEAWKVEFNKEAYDKDKFYPDEVVDCKGPL